VKFVRYLNAGNYFGTDLNASLLQAGYDIEIANEGLLEELPRSNLITDEKFDFSWAAQPFHFALAQSVFTHLPLNHMRVCLERLASAVRAEGRFYITFFEILAGHPTYQSYHHELGGTVTQGAADPYHYRASDVEFAAAGLCGALLRVLEMHWPMRSLCRDVRRTRQSYPGRLALSKGYILSQITD
jgi:hypothetical protein